MSCSSHLIVNIFITQLQEDTIYEVLCAGDLYLLPGLKRYCGGVLSKYLDIENVVHIIKTARMFDLGKLEDDCAAFMAEHIEKVKQQLVYVPLLEKFAS